MRGLRGLLGRQENRKIILSCFVPGLNLNRDYNGRFDDTRQTCLFGGGTHGNRLVIVILIQDR